jgi:hypothetical protein
MGRYFTAKIGNKMMLYRACCLVLYLRNCNAAGWVNFQNPQAITNYGSLLEVLLALAIPNTAALACGAVLLTCRMSPLICFLAIQ